MFSKVLIANRGAIATRIIRTLRSHGCRERRRLFGGRPSCGACRAGRRGGCDRPGARGAELSQGRCNSRGGAQDRRRGHPPGLRLSFRESGFCRGLREGRHPLHRTAGRADAGVRAQAQGAGAGAQGGCAARAGLGSRARCRACAQRGGAHRLSGDAEEHGGRRRHRAAARQFRGRTRVRRSSASSAWRATTSRTAESSSRSTSRAGGISRCRSSATAAAASSRSASATARRSGAIRR